MMYSSAELSYSDNKPLYAQRFKPLKTLNDAYLHLLVTVLLELLVVGILCVQIPILNKWNDLSSLYYCQAAFWIISLLFHYIYIRDHWFLKLGGHFTCYRKLQRYVYIYFLMPSFFNIIFIILQAIFKRHNCINAANLELNYYITGGILSFEVFITLPIIIGYIINVYKFNNEKPIPDTEKYEYMLPCETRSSSEIGYRLEGEAVADLLEKQADLIFYLKSTITEMNCKLANYAS